MIGLTSEPFTSQSCSKSAQKRELTHSQDFNIDIQLTSRLSEIAFWPVWAPHERKDCLLVEGKPVLARYRLTFSKMQATFRGGFGAWKAQTTNRVNPIPSNYLTIVADFCRGR